MPTYKAKIEIPETKKSPRKDTQVTVWADDPFEAVVKAAGLIRQSGIDDWGDMQIFSSDGRLVLDTAKITQRIRP